MMTATLLLALFGLAVFLGVVYGLCKAASDADDLRERLTDDE